ncbi:TIGR02206 family membrane protein [Lederbergia sp. NSJ-179]|uniref:YwaF family protein n=1 Tax=Lederbergia sp. NSJ-179 TaxID=2931402 RepID=UPI001FD29267|nr:TIGR02206 family membrane protein [Lederbergia sp. NSJ-179]MCJ7839791.1 TIGR02206 family membrane protein [Lederbergia sp. NSJ-179]
MKFTNEPSFVIFSTAHIAAVIVGFIIVYILFVTRKKWDGIGAIEKIFAISLLIMELLYQTWMWKTDRWDVSYSLPLELCSISLILTIGLLWTDNRHLHDFVFYAGIGGALQAIITPDLELSFSHFRYFHFFYTHFGIILTACYFTWVKGYRPTFKGLLKTMLILNLLALIVFVVNQLVKGNYMFLRNKPDGGSLLDYLGPYPWYLLSMEFVAFCIFIFLWGIFREDEEL